MKNNKVFYGVSENMKGAFDGYKIQLIEKRFSKTPSGKSWKANADKEKTTIISFKEYFNYISSVDFFKNLGGTERVEKGYTIAGYIPTKLTSINPSKDVKIIRQFKITRA